MKTMRSRAVGGPKPPTARKWLPLVPPTKRRPSATPRSNPSRKESPRPRSRKSSRIRLSPELLRAAENHQGRKASPSEPCTRAGEEKLEPPMGSPLVRRWGTHRHASKATHLGCVAKTTNAPDKTRGVHGSRERRKPLT